MLTNEGRLFKRNSTLDMTDIFFHLCIIQSVLLLIQVNSVVTNDWVVVVSVSEWYDDIFSNWSLWYKRLNLGMETIVIAEDNVTYDKYKNHSDFKTLHFDMDEVYFVLFVSYFPFKRPRAFKARPLLSLTFIHLHHLHLHHFNDFSK